MFLQQNKPFCSDEIYFRQLSTNQSDGTVRPHGIGFNGMFWKQLRSILDNCKFEESLTEDYAMPCMT